MEQYFWIWVPKQNFLLSDHYAQNSFVRKFWVAQDSNPGRLDKKREHYPCAMLSPGLMQHVITLVEVEKRQNIVPGKSKKLPTLAFGSSRPRCKSIGFTRLPLLAKSSPCPTTLKRNKTWLDDQLVLGSERCHSWPRGQTWKNSLIKFVGK